MATFQIPSLPPIPSIDVPATPNFSGPVNPALTASINTNAAHLKNINSIYDPQFAAAQAKFNAAITPYGTSEQPGQAYRDSLRSVKQRSAAHGLLYSSFNDRDMGAAIGRLNDQARAVYDNYASDIKKIADAEQSDVTNTTTTLTTLFGQNADWLQNNPPVVAPPPTFPTPAAATSPAYQKPVAALGPNPTFNHTVKPSTQKVYTKAEWLAYHQANGTKPTGTYEQYVAARR